MNRISANTIEDLFRNSNIALFKTRLFRDSNHPTLVSDSAKFEIGVRIIGKDSI